MSKPSESGSKAKTELSQSEKLPFKELAFSATAYDLEHMQVLRIVGNSRLTAGGPTGVIVFIPGATVGNDGFINFPLAISANKEIANAETLEGNNEK